MIHFFLKCKCKKNWVSDLTERDASKHKWSNILTGLLKTLGFKAKIKKKDVDYICNSKIS